MKRKHFDLMGLKHFKKIQEGLNNVVENSTIFPIFVPDSDTTIESRTRYIENFLPELLESSNWKDCHLIAYSISGLDFRYFLHKNPKQTLIKSLFTLSSPHRGSFLADAVDVKKMKSEDVEPVIRAMGVTEASFQEFNTKNITAFNSSVVQPAEVPLFSYSAEAVRTRNNEIYQTTHQFLQENVAKGFNTSNDGVFVADETKWGTYVRSLSANHAELIGVGDHSFDVQRIYSTVLKDVLSYDQSLNKQK
eukprot:CAMPEP_0176441268 /NCGR_PEP_ID=MMETSP0127-20121128/21091_1 /TAXON_ID=938130 /ORGANISM="Platyophrya macrostoma, Strain WH" /LENGTH=248 /DNA_ID=CAMNT_0017826003 /DNA_START=81 /DNA_END=827 /DNA_ORIENTATION=+